MAKENLLDWPPEAPNACPECGHTPSLEQRGCFATDIVCRNWRGELIPCLCANEAHFEGTVK